RLGAVLLSGGQDSRADPAAIEAALLEGVRTHGLALLPWSEGARSLRSRAAFARGADLSLPDLSDDALLASLDGWLPPLLAGKRRLGDLNVELPLGWAERQAIERIAPSHFETP